jgi:transposase-like protein
MMTKRIFPWVLAVSKRLLRQMSTMTKPRFLTEYDRAVLRTTLAFPGTAPAVFTNENVRGLLGADETCMTCPRCASAGQGRVDGGRRCQEFRCDECGYAFGKST